ncbi:MAG: hypothetical protein WAW37_16420 [Syntrophobacteraceae bacterium]
MGIENRIWQALTLLAALLNALVPAYVAMDLFTRGESPPKRQLELNKLSVIGLYFDVRQLGEQASLTVRMPDGQTFNNIASASAIIKNIGTSPILPSDIHENISINVPKPWKIITVSSLGSRFTLHWHKISDNKFEADPTLINPGDSIFITAYMTNLDSDKYLDYSELSKINVQWRARITNMTDFASPQTPSQRNSKSEGWVIIQLVDWALIFTILTAMLFQVLYLQLFKRIHLWDNLKWSIMPSVLISTFVSYSAAESIATYLYPNELTRTYGVYHSFNIPFILLNLALLITLWIKVARQTTVTSHK